MKIVYSTENQCFALTRKTFREFSMNGETDTLNFRSLPRTAMRQFFSLSPTQQQKGRHLIWTYNDADCDFTFRQSFTVVIDAAGRLHAGCKTFTTNTTNIIGVWALVKYIPRA